VYFEGKMDVSNKKAMRRELQQDIEEEEKCDE
jgi:hypothetical protein